MKTTLICHIICSLLISLLISCHSDYHDHFSKYIPNNSNDVSTQELKGQIKKIEVYHNGQLDRILSFNKWGFFEEYTFFTDNSISKDQRYTYDEYGKLKKVVFTFPKENNKVITYLYKYNNKKDNISIVSESSSNNNSHIDKHFVKTCKYLYNNSGQIYKIITDIEHSLDGLMNYSLYDEDGRQIESGYQNQSGTVTDKTKYTYNANGYLSRTDNYSYDGDTTMHHYTTFYYEIPNKPYLLSTEAVDEGKNSKLCTYKYDSNDNVVLKKLWEHGLLTTTSYYRYKYDNNKNWIEKLDSTLIFNPKNKEYATYVDTIQRDITYY